MSDSKPLDTKKLARPWLNNAESESVTESYAETPTPIRRKKLNRFPASLALASVGLASAITLLVVLGLVLVFGVKV